MTSLAQKLSLIVGDAFAAQGLARELGVVRVADRPDLAQFQCNGALPAGKQAGKNPREVAQSVIDTLKGRSEFTKLEIAGPGFININLSDEMIAAHVAALDARQGVDKTSVPETIILDYGGYNIAKPLHVGHLRSTIIGDAVNRILAFAGHKTIGDVHFGDWGTQMGTVISELEIRHPDWPYFDQNHKGGYPNASPVTLEDLDEIYPAASKACKEDPARLEKARQATRDLQNGRAGYRALWQHFVDVSMEAVKKSLKDLGVDFDLWNGEASVDLLIADMVADLKKKKLAEESDGALILRVALPDDKKEMPPLMLYKSDGAVMYGTTDLATILERVRDYKDLAKVIYIVDQRQSLHFEQVFRAARMAGIAPERVELIHAGFGTMNGPDGKPFKTRAGGVMKLEDLIGTALEKARTRLAEADLAQDMNAAEKEDVAHKVALAALKFADLQNNRAADYVFDIDRMTAFEGKTGPYLLYQAVRIKSLLRKAAEQGVKPGAITVRDEDRGLALLLAELPDHFAGALRGYTPHVLCDYAYRLAQEFSRFYASCHILSEADKGLQASRLALCALTEAQLGLVLGLLGIEIPERM